VALKVLPAQTLADPYQVQRFEREARSAARLHHTNIVPVFGVGECDGTHFYVMQFIQGRGLDSILEMLRNSQRSRSTDAAGADQPESAAQLFVRSGTAYGRVSDPARSDTGTRIGGRSIRTGPLSEADRRSTRNVARIGVQVAQALAYAHAQGIVHRDIKPSNLLLDDNGTVWVADFGLAKMVGADDATHSGFIAGTLRYMAPERFSGKGDARADIYALGMTLYELLSLRPAFEENDRTSLIRLVTQEDPPRLRKLNRKLPTDLETIVHTAIAREPARRYATAAALAEDLQRFLDGRPSRARRVGVIERSWRWCRRNPIVAGLTAAVFVLLAAAAAIASVGYVQTKMALSGEARHRAAAEALEAKANEEAGRARAAEQEMRAEWYAASINLMQQAWDTSQLSRLRGLLADTEPYPDRGFEWFYWQRLCHLDRGTLIGHRAEIRSISWSPDGKLLATGSMDGTARIWESSGGRERFALKGHMSQVTSVSWSPNGIFLATASWDGTAKVWSAEDGQEQRTLEGHANRVWSVAWSPDGRCLATGSHTGTVRIWEAASGHERFVLKGHTSPVYSVAWSPDCKLLATGSADGSAKVWEAVDGRERLTLKGHASPVSSVAWSPDGKLLATGSADGTARAWVIADSRLSVTFEGHDADVSCAL
jgi:eukaryotic-like serine/threonine-protein kinase